MLDPEDPADYYYAGLPSRVRLIGRSSTTPWKGPTGLESYIRPKVLGVVGKHPIGDIWEGRLSHSVVDHLDSKKIAWTSIDIVRIGYADESFHPVILWIGVRPETLSVEDGTKLAVTCKDILEQSAIFDVDVEIRESIVNFLNGPKFLPPTSFLVPMYEIRKPLTSTLGISISSMLSLWKEGTGGFFIAEGGGSKRIFLVTARHVIFKPSRGDNDMYQHESHMPRRNVVLLGDEAFKKLVASIPAEIFNKEVELDELSRIKQLHNATSDGLNQYDRIGAEAVAKIEALKILSKDILKHWVDPVKRVIGHVLYAPPIEHGVRTEQHMQDFAVIDLDVSKIDASNFQGNLIHLSTKISPSTFAHKMFPNNRNAHTFYPAGGLLKLTGVIPDDEMHCPTASDQELDSYPVVVKNGHGTGLTIGLANNICSCVRYSFEDGSDLDSYSMEWAILSYDNKSGPFSAPGDSGSVVADGQGRVGGIIMGGAGATDSVDVTYMTSINFIMKSIKAKYPSAHLNPTFCT